MKNQSFLKRLSDFALGKGFYIVLFLCIATIGISGYYLVRTMTGAPENIAPVTGHPEIVLPDSEANGPDPIPTDPNITWAEIQTGNPQETRVPAEQTDPDAPLPNGLSEQESAPPEKPTAVVYTWPVKGEILRDFSVETLSLDPTLDDWRTHNGLDIAAAIGTQVLAMRAGSVSEVFEDGLMGTTVVVDHGDGLKSTYSNLAAQPTVNPGDVVETGTVIGAVGDTGIAERGIVSHLHLEASLNGQRVDPTEYLPAR